MIEMSRGSILMLLPPSHSPPTPGLLAEDANTLPGRLEPFVEARSMKFVVAVIALQVGHLVRLDA